VVGQSVLEYGEKAKSVSALLFTGYGSACLSLYLDWTQIMGVSSLTSIFIITAGGTGLPSPGLALTRKTIAVMWSKRIGQW